MTIVGISGKIGAGKNYLASALIEELQKRGYTTNEASFATPLKSELTSIISYIRENLHTGQEEIVYAGVAEKYSMPYKQAVTIVDYITDDIQNETSPLDGYSRTEGIRRALQYLGTDVRRNVDDQYWVKRFHTDVPTEDFVFVTDVRFANEADSVKDNGGLILRLEPPAEIVAERVNARDGVQYSEAAHQHISETALDNYPRFDLVISTSTFDVEDIVDFLTSN